MFEQKTQCAAEAHGGKWEGAEEWMPLAWELCANENGEEACNELIWEGGPIPEPWGERWLKYEGQARLMIDMVRKHVRSDPDVQPKGTPDKQAEIDKLVSALAACRDVFPIPEPGAPHEGAWMLAIGHPAEVPDYVRAAFAAAVPPPAPAQQGGELEAQNAAFNRHYDEETDVRNDRLWFDHGWKARVAWARTQAPAVGPQVRRQDVRMAAALMDEAANLLEAVGPETLEKLPGYRWPLADELGGAACIMRDYLPVSHVPVQRIENA